MGEMMDRLVELGRVKAEDRDELVVAVMEREDQIGTGVGNGVAIPHARIDGLEKAVAIFGRSIPGVNFQSQDDSLAHCIYLLLTPAEQAGQHLQTLADLARVFGDCRIREDVLAAETAEDVAARLASA